MQQIYEGSPECITEDRTGFHPSIFVGHCIKHIAKNPSRHPPVPREHQNPHAKRLKGWNRDDWNTLIRERPQPNKKQNYYPLYNAYDLRLGGAEHQVNIHTIIREKYYARQEAQQVQKEERARQRQRQRQQQKDEREQQRQIRRREQKKKKTRNGGEKSEDDEDDEEEEEEEESSPEDTTESQSEDDSKENDIEKILQAPDTYNFQTSYHFHNFFHTVRRSVLNITRMDMPMHRHHRNNCRNYMKMSP